MDSGVIPEGCPSRVLLVGLCELGVSLLGAWLCALTMVLLRRFNVFHLNLRQLLANVAFIILLGAAHASLRLIVIVYQCSNGQAWTNSTVKEGGGASSCFLRDSISPAVSVALVISGICIAIERLYATHNFAIYEYQTMGRVVTAACIVTMLPIILCVVGFVVSVLQGNALLAHSCPPLLHGDFLKANTVYIIAALFQAVLFVLYVLIYLDNKARRVEYIRDHYDSFSSRFQINENIKSTALLLPSSLALLFLFAHTILTTPIHDSHRPIHSHTTTKEMRNLMYPMFSIIFPLSFIYRCPIFYAKARGVAVGMFLPRSKERRGNPLLSEKQRAHFELLVASWEEDATKVQ